MIHKAVRAAREQAEVAREAMVEASPAALERCADALRAAIGALEPCRAGASDNASAQATQEALRFQADLRVLARLLEHAAEYHARWLGFAASVWAGYTGSGAAAELPRRGRLLTRG